MPKLSDQALRHYREQGYYAPVRAMSPEDAARFRDRLETFEAGNPDARAPLRNKSHLVFTWADELIRAPGILDAVESVIGPNILCWGSSFFIKDAHDPGYVSWHQDSTYWGLEPPDIITAWVALSDSVADNGAMRVIPGTHKLDQVSHRDTFAAHNLLSRGQEIAVDVDERQAVALELQPGEMSLHHVRLIHGSEPNPSGRRRIGFAIRYLPTHVRQVAGTRDSATLVRGVDEHHHFAPERRPDADLSEASLAYHAQVMGETDKVLMREAGRTGTA
jgi:non-haem Fe2+, alpha-ketoglutarate-dependent halogenase